MSDDVWSDPQPTLGDDTLRLRPWRLEDAPWVHAACQDPEIQRWTRVSSPYDLENAQRFVAHSAPLAWEDHRGAHFAAVDPVSGEGWGSFGVVRLSRDRRVGELGYWTAPGARRRGVSTRALRTLAHWSIESLGLVRAELWIEDSNEASRALATRVGFRLEGVMRKKVWHRDADRDVAIYALTDDDLAVD